MQIGSTVWDDTVQRRSDDLDRGCFAEMPSEQRPGKRKTG